MHINPIWMHSLTLKFFPAAHTDPQEAWSPKKLARECQFSFFFCLVCSPSKKWFVFALPCSRQSGQRVVIRRPEWNSCLARLTTGLFKPFYAFENVVFCPTCQTHCLLMVPGSDPASLCILNLALDFGFPSGPPRIQVSYLDRTSQRPASAGKTPIHNVWEHFEDKL